jgi:hypothetical protein
MEFPKNIAELGIWLAMQFPVLAAAALLARWAVRYTEKLHEKRIEDARTLFAGLITEKDKRLQERDRRIEELQAEVLELRTKLTRSKKPPEEHKAADGDKS